MKRCKLLALMLYLLCAFDCFPQESNNTTDLNSDIIVSARTHESVWINDSTLFEAPISQLKKASNVYDAKVSTSQRLTYDFLRHESKYYTNHDPATIMISLDESGNIVDWEILHASFSRSVAQSYVAGLQANFNYTPAKINGKPVKSIGIWVFEMGPQENWRAGGPIDTFERTISFNWSPIFE